MPDEPQFRHAVLAAREQLVTGRDTLKRRHERGLSGPRLSSQLTDLWDEVILGLFQSALSDAGGAGLEREVALVGLGGYGRRDVSPHSDVDLMLLTPPAARDRVSEVAKFLARDICDAGLQLGFSLRTPAEACSLGMKDATIFTSLAESRFLCGSDRLFQGFSSRYRSAMKHRWRSLLSTVVASRGQERTKYGETSHLLEPNIKRTRGGLRDVQLVRWAGFTKYGETDLDRLEELGALKSVDRRRLRRAHAFLLRLRNELHFHAGKSQDVMTRNEQVRIAAIQEYELLGGLLPVERFMREYFEQTGEIRDVSAGFIDNLRARSGFVATVAPLFSRRLGGDFRVGPVHVGATRRGLDKMRHDLAKVLGLMDLASMYQKRIDHHTWETIRVDMANRPPRSIPAEAVAHFISLMGQPGRLGNLLRRLHQLRVLEQIIPAFQHARYLMQFNDYHKYTVDEHSIRAVEAATSFGNDSRAIGHAYRDVRNKHILHLALLIHDLGKGYDNDHSEVGASIAVDVASRLRLTEGETENLRFLVANHLLMSHMAFREDMHDESVILRLARAVGSTDLLQMLYVLSVADLAAVGPRVLNEWKLELLTELYFRARGHFTGESASQSAAREADRRRETVRKLGAISKHASWWEDQIAALPNSYLLSESPENITEILRKLERLEQDTAIAWSTYAQQHQVSVYMVGTYESVSPGIFHKLAGALTSKGLQILSAEIHTLAHGLVLDRFYVEDMDFVGNPPPERTEEIRDSLVRSLTVDADKLPVFRNIWDTRQGSRAADHAKLPTQVRFDDATSNHFTIITIFTYDRRGLLYSIARALFELELDVHVAKIGTYLDQVVDAFYVTDMQGRKIHGREKRSQIRQRLEEALAADS
ncbi:MAG: [protein-PII] uridylyltransferase [Planctomycetota bacterium]